MLILRALMRGSALMGLLLVLAGSMSASAQDARQAALEQKVRADLLLRQMPAPPCRSTEGPVAAAKCFRSSRGRQWLEVNEQAINEIVDLYQSALAGDPGQQTLTAEVSNAMQRSGRYCQAAELLQASYAEIVGKGYKVSAPAAIEAARTEIGCALLSEDRERLAALGAARSICSQELEMAMKTGYLRSAAFAKSHRAKIFSNWMLAFDYENENPRSASDTAIVIANPDRVDLQQSWDRLLKVFTDYRGSIPGYVRAPEKPDAFARSIAGALDYIAQNP